MQSSYVFKIIRIILASPTLVTCDTRSQIPSSFEIFKIFFYMNLSNELWNIEFIDPHWVYINFNNTFGIIELIYNLVWTCAAVCCNFSGVYKYNPILLEILTEKECKAAVVVNFNVPNLGEDSRRYTSLISVHLFTLLASYWFKWLKWVSISWDFFTGATKIAIWNGMSRASILRDEQFVNGILITFQIT